MNLVYCSKCGTKNEEDVEYCIKCGANLEVSREKRLERRAKEWGEEFGRRAEEWGEQFGRRAEKECFGLPHGGALIGVVIGIIIIAGITQVPGIRKVSDSIEPSEYIGPIAAILFGTLVLAGSLYRIYSRRY